MYFPSAWLSSPLSPENETIMRKTTFALAAAFIVLTILSCGKDKDASKPSIVGKWTLVTFKEYYYENGETTPSDSLVYIKGETDTTLVTYTFNADKSLIETSSDGTTTTNTYSYHSDDNTLNTKEDGYDYVYNVTELTTHSLKLSDDISSTDDNGTPFKITLNLDFQR